MRYLVVSLVGMMFLVTATIVSLPYMAGGDFVIRHVQDEVKRKTGRTLTLLQSPIVSVFPDTMVSIEGASLSNPPAMFDGTIVSMERLEAKVSMWQMITRQAGIESLTIIRPRITLVIDKDGNANWQLPGAAEQAPAAAQPQSQPAEGGTLQPVRIVDGEISFTDERSGATFKADAVNGEITLPVEGQSLSMQGNLRWNGKRADVRVFIKDMARLAGGGSPVELAIDAEPLDIAASGLLRLAGGLDLAGQVNLNSKDLRQVVRWGGWQAADGAGLKDVSVSGAVSVSGNRVAIEEATVRMDGMIGNGLVRVLLREGRPRVEASLGVTKLDLNVYRSAGTSAGTSQTAAGWSRQPVDLSGLNMTDAVLRIRANEVLYGKLAMKDVSIDATLENGKLSSTLNSLTLYGGSASGRMEIDGSQNTPRLAGSLEAKGADARLLLADLAGINEVTGTADVSLDLTGSGTSQAEMVSTLGGTASLSLSDGELAGIDVVAVVQGVQRSILEGWTTAGSGSTRYDRLQARFEVRDGIAETRQLELQGPGLSVTGEGTADLLRRKLDLKVVPQVANADGSGVTRLPVPVVLSGDWSAPRIYPDVEGILDNPQSAFDTLGRLGVNMPAAGGALKTGAEKLLGREGAEEAGEIGRQLIDGLLKQTDQ